VVKIMERLDTMRMVDWVVWNIQDNTTTKIVRMLTGSMCPLIVKFPVSGSLIGRSSKLKDSAKWTKYSMSRWLNLKHKITNFLRFSKCLGDEPYTEAANIHFESIISCQTIYFRTYFIAFLSGTVNNYVISHSFHLNLLTFFFTGLWNS
jgi:hypothetical protein